MSRQSEESVRIRQVGYDPVTRTLMLIWENGEVERYAGVPREVYDQLHEAPSLERFVRESIRGRYPGESPPSSEWGGCE